MSNSTSAPHLTAGRRLFALTGALFLAALWLGPISAHASYTASVQGTTLVVVGSGASDKLAVRLASGAPTMLELDVGDNGTADFTFDRTTFTGVSVAAGGGNDQIRVDQINGAFTDESTVFDGGKGNDTLAGGDGADLLIGGDGNDAADGNRGDDVALLGNGNDSFHWDPGDGSDTLEGQDGNDVLDFSGANIAEHIDVSANGGRVRFTRDIASITMDLNDVEGIIYHALGGADTITANDATGTDLKTFAVDLAATGGGDDLAIDNVIAQGTAGADQLRVSQTGGKISITGLAEAITVTGGEAANDVVQALGNAGNDVITVAAGVVGVSGITLDGGNDVDTTNFEGTKAADLIAITPNITAATITEAGTAPVSSTAESLHVLGMKGNDTISATGNLIGVTALVFDGGSGNDTLRGSNTADILVGGDGNDTADGNQGDDVALLGKGNDSFHWDPGDGSDTLEGQDGNDVLDFSGANIAEHIDVSANGGRVRFTRDIASITMDLNDVEGIIYHALGGADTITANDATGTDLKTFDIDLATNLGAGDGAIDTVIVNGTAGVDKVKATSSGSQVKVSGLAVQTRITGSELANDSLHLNTLAGNDQVTVAPSVNTLIQTVVDLGTDE